MLKLKYHFDSGPHRPALNSVCTLDGTPIPLASRSNVSDFPTFLSLQEEWSMPMELSSKVHSDTEKCFSNSCKKT